MGEFLADVNELLSAMRAGVARANGLHAGGSNLGASCAIAKKAFDFALHRLSVLHR
ncbi:MAG TPA: hypothetical protein VE998_08105 [Terriglobales bacterium]|nr:hypothetical protein [Terriglobales bacterium]